MSVSLCFCYKVENKMFAVNNLVSIKIQQKKNNKKKQKITACNEIHWITHTVLLHLAFTGPTRQQTHI